MSTALRGLARLKEEARFVVNILRAREPWQQEDIRQAIWNSLVTGIRESLEPEALLGISIPATPPEDFSADSNEFDFGLTVPGHLPIQARYVRFTDSRGVTWGRRKWFSPCTLPEEETECESLWRIVRGPDDYAYVPDLGMALYYAEELLHSDGDKGTTITDVAEAA